MAAPAFDYRAAGDLGEALGVLAAHGEDAKVLAGGQSLVPMMHLRLARPAVLLDINRLPGLDGAAVVDGELRLGALVRHRRLERPFVADPLGALLAAAARHVGHLPIRVRGTFAGSLAHADPAAEWCLIAVTVDARLVLASASGGMGQWVWPRLAAVYVMAVLPGSIVFGFAQRWYMKGLQEGALKA